MKKSLLISVLFVLPALAMEPEQDKQAALTAQKKEELSKPVTIINKETDDKHEIPANNPRLLASYEQEMDTSSNFDALLRYVNTHRNYEEEIDELASYNYNFEAAKISRNGEEIDKLTSDSKELVKYMPK